MGSAFLCAPRENSAPQFSLVRVGSDGRWAIELSGDQ
jgi:hypothetical protein